MLLITPFVGVRANDAHRWLEIFGFQFQPSEFAKLACIVFVSFILSKRVKFTDEKSLKYILIGIGVTCFLILPENFSTAFMLFGVCFLMMFIGQLPLVKLGKVAIVLAVALVAFIAVLYFVPEGVFSKYFSRAATWKERVVDFTKHENKAEDGDTYVINDDNYQVSHAKIAIVRGGVFGRLPGHSLQRDFLPQAYSDFIYAIIIEELGLIGGFFVLLLYVMLLIRVGMIAKKCDKLFPKYLVLGCGLLIVVQAIANMAVAVNLIPVTGQPLPLISRGGTSTMISCVYFGIILSISRYAEGIGMDEESEEEKEENQTGPDPGQQDLPVATEEEDSEIYEIIEKNPLKAVNPPSKANQS